MNEAKYIIVKAGFLFSELAIVFDFIIEHSTIAQSFQQENIVSAGFVQFYPDEHKEGRVLCSAYSKSTTLKLESRKEDKEIIERSIVKFEDWS